MKQTLYSLTLGIFLIILASEGLARIRTETDSGTKITIERGDTLWAIAKSEWGKGILYTRLWEMREDRGLTTSPHRIFPKMTFLIPKPGPKRSVVAGQEGQVVMTTTPNSAVEGYASILKQLHTDSQNLSQNMEGLAESLERVRHSIDRLGDQNSDSRSTLFLVIAFVLSQLALPISVGAAGGIIAEWLAPKIGLVRGGA